MPAEEIGRRGRRPGSQVNTVLPLVDRQLLAARPQGGRTRSTRPATTRPTAPPCSASGIVPRRASAATAPARRGTPAPPPPYDRDDDRRRCSAGVEPVDDELASRDQALQRDAHRLPLPPVLRHAGRQRRHRPVPARPTAACCSSATTTGSARATSGGRSWPRTCRTTTSPPRSCSTASTARSPTSARRSTDPEDYLDRLVGFGLFTTDTPRRLARSRCRSTSSTRSMAAVRSAQAAHYRAIAAMDRDEKIRCGAYVYFTLPASRSPTMAGVADELDWTRAPGPATRVVRVLLGDGGHQRPRRDEEGPYYSPYVIARRRHEPDGLGMPVAARRPGRRGPPPAR